MTIWRPLLLGLSMSFIGQQIAIGQAVLDRHVNLDSDRLRAIVTASAEEAHTKAVVFGVWAGQREILTSALGNSMTTQPATTDMHYRVGGIAEVGIERVLERAAPEERLQRERSFVGRVRVARYLRGAGVEGAGEDAAN